MRSLAIEPGGGARISVLGGRLKADEEVMLTARVAGRVTALPVHDGGAARRGAALVIFAAPEADAAARAARAGADAARLRRDLALRQSARMDTLFAAGVITRREHELAGDERQAADAAWRAADATREQAAQSLTLGAPFDGVVVRHVVDPGTSVQPGQALLAFRSLASREVVVAIPESSVPDAAVARWWVQDRDGAWRAARLLRLEGASDPTTRSRLAYISASTAGSAQAGDFVRVRLEVATATRDAAARVPSAAVVTRGELAGVYVLRDGHAWLRWVRLGGDDGAGREVLAGLERGERIAADAAGLTDGVAIRIRP